jgi:hypothetical protein
MNVANYSHFSIRKYDRYIGSSNLVLEVPAKRISHITFTCRSCWILGRTWVLTLSTEATCNVIPLDPAARRIVPSSKAEVTPDWAQLGNTGRLSSPTRQHPIWKASGKGEGGPGSEGTTSPQDYVFGHVQTTAEPGWWQRVGATEPGKVRRGGDNHGKKEKCNGHFELIW